MSPFNRQYLFHNDSDAISSEKTSHGSQWSTKRFVISVLCAIFLASLFFGLILLVATGSGTPSLSYNDLNYDVRVLSNGDLRIKQRVDVKLLARDTDDGHKPWKSLYQRYQINPSNLTGISDVSVRDLDSQKTFTRIDSISPNQIGNVPDWKTSQANHWYMGIVDEKGYNTNQNYEYSSDEKETSSSCSHGQETCTVELGWNIPPTVEAESLVFEIEMTWHGVSTAYDDVSAFQWEPVGPTNQVPIQSLTGKIQLPSGANRKNSKAWLHYTGESQNSWSKDSVLQFEAKEVDSGNHVDVKVMMDAGLTPAVARVHKGKQAKAITSAEEEQESNWRHSQQVKARTLLAALIILGLLILILGVLLILAAFKSFGEIQYGGNVIYRREPPEMSPAAAAQLSAFLYDDNNKLYFRQTAATLLSLANKGFIALYPGSIDNFDGLDLQHVDVRALGERIRERKKTSKESGGTSTVVLNSTADNTKAQSQDLTKSESALLRILQTAAQELDSQVFDFMQMSFVLQQHHRSLILLENFNNAVAREFGALAVKRPSVKFQVLLTLACILTVGIGLSSMVIDRPLLFIAEGWVLGLISSFSLCYGCHEVLTEEGQHWAGQIVSFRKYLMDFSSFKERGVNDLAMWGTYLVYATALGISKEALQELARSYPEVIDADWLDDNYNYGLIYMLYAPLAYDHNSSQSMGEAGFGGVNSLPAFSDLGDAFSRDVQLLQTSSNSYSISGGSFSGGGFGGSSGGSGGGSFGGN